MNQRFDMIWFGRMGLNREGKTATQGCEAKHGGAGQGRPKHTLFGSLPREFVTNPKAPSRGGVPAVDPRVFSGHSTAEAVANFSS